ncbi:DUF1559 domain-containing protein [Rhodopirellula bahusiensis]|uniref:DUF1559 domain-containing protein n=1 Tax=Rhodopirellula bahusiensis TaxID=2014065 RepID=A0A2G1W0T4_9BACT|nr:DUF1559 domain-containing protein [Rhodopirellula bahusiensis]PHQ32633.1 hypothetical protein CEE69_24625 [Rhodopirellula bahusiensis]
MRGNRSGVTLLEVVVVVICIGILMALLIPAVNSPRRGGRRNQCTIQLKNLSLAAIQYENTKGEMPGWVMEFGHFGWDTETETVLSPLRDPTAEWHEGSSQNLAPHRKIGPWAVALLPWLDAQPTYEHWTEDRYPILTRAEGSTTGFSGQGFHPLAAPNLAIMQCPSDHSLAENEGRNSYVANAGVFFPPRDMVAGEHAIFHPIGEIKTVSFAESMTEEFGVFGNQLSARLKQADQEARVPIAKPIHLDDFRDGSSNAVLFSESLHALSWHRSGFVNDEDLIFENHPDDVFYPELSRFTNAMVWHGVDWSNGKKPRELHRINGEHELTMHMQMSRTNAADLARPSSAHAEGVNVSMADGGTRFISETIDMRVWQALMTPRGREPISEDAM